jgi:hypothetical protein
MRDARFRAETTWRLGMDQMRREAEAEVARRGDPKVLQAAVGVLLATDSSGWGALVGCAVPTFPAALREGVERFLDGEVDLEPASWWLIVNALAMDACLGSPASSRIVAADERLHRAPQWVHATFLRACLTLIGQAPASLQEAWLVEFARPLAIVQPIEPVAEPVRVYRRERTWQIHDPFEVWHSPPMALAEVDDHVPTTILRNLDPDRWFRAVQQWSDAPLLLGALFGAHIFHDRDALLRWLAAAEPAFDADGRWTGKLAAIILARHVVRAARMLLDAMASDARSSRSEMGCEPSADDVEAARRVELPQFFKDAWEALLARSDGEVIAAALHAELVDPNATTGSDKLDDATEIARTCLTRALSEQGLQSGRIHALWEERQRTRAAAKLGARVGHVSGVCALVSALELTLLRGEVCDDALQAMLFDRLAAPDPDWAWSVQRGTLNKILARFVSALARRSGALEQLERLYESLEPVRRRGEYGRTYITNDTDLPSVLVLVVLLGLIDELPADAPRVEESVKRCLGWATRLVLTSSPAFQPTTDPEAIFAFAVRLCARFAPALVPGAFEIARPDPALAALTATALLSVMSRVDLDALLARVGDSLEALRERARALAETTQRPNDLAAFSQLVKVAPFQASS